MNLKNSLIVTFFVLFVFACAEDNDITVPRNLQEYIDATANKDFGEVIACAANAEENTSLAYIFYYPEEGATDIRYYEADNLNVDPNNFVNYRRKSLQSQDVFGGKLQRFSRSGSEENWCLVTYVINGKLHKSNPIRLKNTSKTTQYKDEVTIEYPSTLEPKFTWSDFGVSDNKVYFQVISKTSENNFLSGVYISEQNEKVFKYQDFTNSNIDQNLYSKINTTTPPALEIDKEYLFTSMAVSQDNWVNVIIEEKFVPGNLQEFLTTNDLDNSKNITAFAASENNNQNLTYIYYHPLTNARDFRYYETQDAFADKDDFTNYRRKFLTDQAIFGAKLRQFSRTDSEESWAIVTYEIDGKILTSAPIKLYNKKQPTQYQTEVTKQTVNTNKLQFTWSDFGTVNNRYFQVMENKSGTFLSGTFTNENTFTYYDTTNVTQNITTETPPDLILNEAYNLTIFGLSNDNWVNLAIDHAFEFK